MTRSISSPKLSIKLSGTVVNTLTDGSSTTAAQPVLSYAPALSNGLGDNAADRGWHMLNHTLAAGEQDIIDLADFSGTDIGAGVGKDAVGQTLTLMEIVVLAIVNENAVAAAGVLEIVPSVSEGWAPVGSHTVANGGALYGQGLLLKSQMADYGFPILENSHRITLKATGGDVSYSIYLLARSDYETSSSSSSSSLSSSSLSSSSQSSSSSSASTSTSSISTSSASSLSSSSQSSLSSSSISTSSSSLSSSSQSSSSISSASSP